MTREKSLAMVAAICLVLLAQAAAVHAATSVFPVPETTNVNDGESFTVDINISTDANVFGVIVPIEFDNAVLNVTGITEGEFLSKDGNLTFLSDKVNNTKGRIYCTVTRLGYNVSGVTGDGTLFTVNFDTLGSGWSGINLTGVEVYDPDVVLIPSTSTNGSAAVNGMPVMDPLGNMSVDEEELLRFTVNATDPDDDTLTYGAQNLPSGATFIGGTFSWTPSDTQEGVYSVNFTVTDGSLTDFEVINITVVDVPPNVAPEITWYSPTASLVEMIGGQAQLFNHTSTDSNGDPLSYSWKFNGSEQSTNKSWIFSPDTSDCGISTVTLDVSDGEFTDNQSWTVEVSLGGDTNNDNTVSIADLQAISDAMNSEPGDADWNEDADVALLDTDIMKIVPGSDGLVSFRDLVYTASKYGRSC